MSISVFGFFCPTGVKILQWQIWECWLSSLVCLFISHFFATLKIWEVVFCLFLLHIFLSLAQSKSNSSPNMSGSLQPTPIPSITSFSCFILQACDSTVHMFNRGAQLPTADWHSGHYTCFPCNVFDLLNAFSLASVFWTSIPEQNK